MPNNLPTISCSPTNRSSVALTRASLFKFVGLLAGVFLLAGYSLIYLAHDLDRAEDVESAFYTKKAVESLENRCARPSRITLFGATLTNICILR
jgi:hypothetical protein